MSRSLISGVLTFAVVGIGLATLFFMLPEAQEAADLDVEAISTLDAVFTSVTGPLPILLFIIMGLAIAGFVGWLAKETPNTGGFSR